MIVDPGKGKADPKAERLKAWKKPANKTERDKLKENRVKEWEQIYGISFPVPKQL